MNQMGSDVELSTDRKIEAMNKGISQIIESTNGQFRALTEKVQNDEITNNFEIFRQEVTASHAQLAKQCESRYERSDQYEKRVVEVELANGHISKQYDPVSKQYEELRIQVELLRNQKLVESKSNTEEVQCMRINNRQSNSRIENTLLIKNY
jgi:hypothetical protein